MKKYLLLNFLFFSIFVPKVTIAIDTPAEVKGGSHHALKKESSKKDALLGKNSSLTLKAYALARKVKDSPKSITGKKVDVIEDVDPPVYSGRNLNQSAHAEDNDPRKPKAVADAKAKFTSKPIVRKDELVGIKVICDVSAKAQGQNTFAKATCKDPFYLTWSPGDLLSFTSILLASSFSQVPIGPGGVLRTIKVTTNIPSLEVLYRLRIKALNFKEPVLDISFVSNPILGIDDSMIEEEIRTKINISEGKLILISDVILYDDILPIFSTVPINKLILSVKDEASAADDAEDLLIKLASLKVSLNKTNVELISWNTIVERDNVGFYIWRATKQQNNNYELTLLGELDNSEWVGPESNENCSIKIQGQLESDNSDQFPKVISAIGNSVKGTCYSFTGTSNLSDGTYYYLLEDINDNGKSTFHCKHIDAVTIGQGPPVDLPSAINFCKKETGSED